MLIAFLIVLTLAVVVLATRLHHHRQAVRQLCEALESKQATLREDLPGAAGPDWEALCASVNRVIGEIASLEREQTSQLTRLTATLGSLQEAVLIVDESRRVRLANPALQAIFPRARSILGQRLELVLQSDAFLAYVNALRNGHPAPPQREIEFIDPASGSTWIEVTGSAIAALDGQDSAWLLFVLHNITRQKQLERMRTDFVANVSHELRTPLSVIKGYVETLVDAGPDLPAEDRDRFLKTIQRHAERLHSLIDDLLTLSRLESADAGLRREPVDLPAMIRDLVEDYRARPAATHHHLATSIDENLSVLAVDTVKLGQVFENLLDNALKYTPKGSRIEVLARLHPAEVILTVRDNGPGIPPADLPHIFERFYRVDKGRSREKGGTGLGLSIVKHIVQLHGGRAWAESALGQGSAFHFSLPLAPPTA